MTLLEEIQQRLNHLPLEKQEEVLVFIAFLQQQSIPSAISSLTPEKAQRLKLALQKVTVLNPFKDILDPSEWQRQIRQDKPLSGRMT